ncbi:transglutaminaseTgpA domain-containing protein [Georgenia deserti]|uniref:TransglutaminaseTgpA domain-containing protein n=1 Tax=Georgenia deserti TaxID=2093781 RepID=A0ABW4L759_9MICO
MIRRGLWLDALLALLATVVVSWPVRALVAGTAWGSAMLAGLLAVAVTGAVARGARVPPAVVLVVQLLAAWWMLAWIFVPGHLAYGLPLLDAARAAADLVESGAATIRHEAVPVTETAGLSFIVATAMVLLGWAVDALAVSVRSPAAAGLPLMIALVVSASGTGEPLSARYFVAAAGAWLLLLARQSYLTMRAWSSRRHGRPLAVASEPVKRPGRGHRRWALTLGAVGVVAAVVVAGAVPHLQPRTLVRGLGNGPGGDSAVQFTESFDLAADLTDRSRRPVLEYRAADEGTAPLRVLASHRYEDGRWRPVEDDEEGEPDDLPPEVVDREDVERTDHELTVVANELSAPQVALPYPRSSLDLGDIPWQEDPRTGTVRVDRRPESYSVTFTEVTGRLPAGIGAGGPERSLDPDLLDVDDASAGIVSEALAEVLDTARPGAADNQLRLAREIQSYLRGPRFTYSLTLADPAPLEDGEEDGERTDPQADPITHFLTTQVGYCTHFATAMVMMSRAAGIPARLALGFLPGERQVDGSYTVVASDAHAWPELYINGLGWTRFEPTPAARSGTAPVYLSAADLPDAPSTADPTPVEEPERPTQEETTAATSEPNESSPPTSSDVGRVAAPVVLGLLALAALLLVVPAAGRWRRESALRRAEDPASRVEGYWQALVAGLADLGVRAPVGATPRRAADRYRRDAELTGAAAAALDRMVARLERARYAAGAADDGPGTRAVAADVRVILEQARSRLPRRRRLGVLLWPASGREQLRSMPERIVAAVRHPRGRAGTGQV